MVSANGPVRPRLRPVEIVVSGKGAQGRALVLRDTEGAATESIALKVEAGVVLALLDDRHTLEEIRAHALLEHGIDLDIEEIGDLVTMLEKALMLEGKALEAARRAAHRALSQSDVREPFHAGSA